MTTVARPSGARIAIEQMLDEARARTLLLVSTLSERDLRAQHDPLMSPIMWDLGHIAHFEELWLTRNLSGPVEFGEMPGTYNPFEHPRRTRGALALPDLEECVAEMRRIRRRVLERLDSVDLEGGSALLRDGYVYHMVAQHEYQHNETMLQTLQLKTGGDYRAPERRALPNATRASEPGAMVRFAGGEVEIGTADRVAAYDNERPRHRLSVHPFWIDVAPVSNGEFVAFIESGGYRERSYWSDGGWAWLTEEAVEAPKYWFRGDDGWHTRTMDRSGPVNRELPVSHVCYYEGEAYARFAGKRLPTEIEWEVAATWDPSRGVQLEYPWGDAPLTGALANVDQLGFGTAPRWAYPRNVSPIGCYGMIGDVWEWTSSDFAPYPGYETFPYAEYSELFFSPDYKVLRGGSWATRPGALRSTFRNWDYPIRRQIFSGFRCARDV